VELRSDIQELLSARPGIFFSNPVVTANAGSISNGSAFTLTA
jgi:hypothetical protein